MLVAHEPDMKSTSPMLSLLAASFGMLQLAQAAAPASQTAEAEFLSNARQLTYEGRRTGEGYFSPDGHALIFQSEREPENPFYQIYILDLQSGESHRVSPGVGKTTCAFFRPGSSEVLFASTHLDPGARSKQQAELEFRASGKERRYSWDYDEHMDLFVSQRDGSGLRRLTGTPGYDAEASYSPDGQLIVFTSLRDAYPADKLSAEDRKRLEMDPAYFGEIYLMHADGSGQRRLTVSPGYDGGPFFSPDGQRIVWRRFDESGALADVFTMRLDGSEVTRITDFGCLSWAPFFHPSGKYIIFTANKLGFSNFELFLADAEGRHQPVRVTHTDGFDGLPVFSPGGQKLCWTSARTSDGSSQLFLADWNDHAAAAKLKQAPWREGGALPAAAEVASDAAKPPGMEPPSLAEYSSAIMAEDVARDIRYLASEALAGRRTGTPGSRQAAQFIADRFQAAGLKPLGDHRSFYQTFEFNAGVRILTNENRLVILREGAEPQSFQPEVDFRPLTFTANGEAEAQVVFAGYGLSLPGSAGEGYDSYAGLDVTNKIVLVLRYVPENVAPKRRQELNRYAALRYKAMLARQRGAKALLVVTGPNSPNAGELAGLTFDSSLAGSEILAASISGRVTEALLAGSGKDLRSLQGELDVENPHASGSFPLQTRVRLATAVQHRKETDRNVLGVLPPVPAGERAEYVLVGAHYDHLGLGESGAMLRQGEEGQVHAGADDNASGVAAVLEIASALAAEREAAPGKPSRGVIFALWSGEELGLIGSTHFAAEPPVGLSNIVGYLNFDMVGRLRENRLTLQGVGSSPGWRRLIEKGNVTAAFNLNVQEDPYLPTDATALYLRQVPVLNFFTGSHEDYHRPTDRPDRVNHPGVERIAQFAHRIITDLTATSNRLEFAQVKETSGQGAGQRDSLRVYLGTIPDYTTDVAGVKLSGVRAGSPAEEAGLQAGDVIVELAGQTIKNIYDYTFALEAVKIGQPAAVVILRAGERRTLAVTPQARK